MTPRAPRGAAPSVNTSNASDQIPVWTGVSVRAPRAFEEGVRHLLADLNDEQYEAVTHGEGPLLVVAGAGTGKTQVITRRVAWLIAQQRALPEEILALTFTDRAAEEMQGRVDRLVPYGYATTPIKTFHAWGDELLRENAHRLGISGELRVLGRAEVVLLLREHLFELGLSRFAPLGDPTRFLGDVAGYISRAKEEGVGADQIAAFGADLCARAEALRLEHPADEKEQRQLNAHADALQRLGEEHGELAAAYRAYRTILARSGLLDFGDQVLLAYELLRDDPLVAARVRERHRWLLVDEYQDTNRLQGALVDLIAQGSRNLTAVGDDDQSIYRFRGAAIENILSFVDRYPDAAKVVLTRNYRSTTPILTAARRLIRFNDPERLETKLGISKELRAEAEGAAPHPVAFRRFRTTADEADWIASEIRASVASGRMPREHAVLVRANVDTAEISRSLNMAGIPWRASGAAGLYDRPEVRLLLAGLRHAADPEAPAPLFLICADPRFKVPAGILAAAVGKSRREHRPLREALQAVGAANPETVRLMSSLGDLVKESVERTSGELLYRWLRASGLLAELTREATPEADEQIRNIGRLFDVVRSRSRLLELDRAPFLVRYLEELGEAGDDPSAADVDPDLDAVALLTVHQAKGLEFPVVFVANMVETRFPARGRAPRLALAAELGGSDQIVPRDPRTPETPTVLDEEALREERRLAYVALTRAREQLYLSASERATGGVRPRKVSRFISEALDLARTQLEETAFTGERSSSIAALEVEEPAGPVLPVRAPGAAEQTPLTLSYTAIEAYLACPLRYHYQQRLRMPLPPHHAAIYGSALHAAVAEFHRGQLAGNPPERAALVDALNRSWQSAGFISRTHEEARYAAALDVIERFSSEERSSGKVPAYVEKDFSFEIGGHKIRGRWDRVDVTPLAVGERTSDIPVIEMSDETLRPTLPMSDEWVVITDYKSGGKDDEEGNATRARDALQLQIYALAWRAATGRLPDEVSLRFLDSGKTATVPVDPKRIAKARDRILEAAAGIQSGSMEAKPDLMNCTYCAYRELCPSSKAPAGRPA
ncbi:MAG: ATP-dependent helicase [Candidatus Limnocylindrus sp.]